MPQTIHDLVGALANFVPRLVGAVVVLLVALVVALLLQRLIVRFLVRLGLENLFERTGPPIASCSSGTRADPRG